MGLGVVESTDTLGDYNLVTSIDKDLDDSRCLHPISC